MANGNGTTRVILNVLAKELGIDPSGLRKVVKNMGIEPVPFLCNGKGAPALTITATEAERVGKLYIEIPDNRIAVSEAAKKLGRDLSGFCKTLKSKGIKTEEYTVKGVGRVQTITKKEFEKLEEELPKRMK